MNEYIALYSLTAHNVDTDEEHITLFSENIQSDTLKNAKEVAGIIKRNPEILLNVQEC